MADDCRTVGGTHPSHAHNCRNDKFELNWTRLSCARFVANQVRLQLFVLAMSSDWDCFGCAGADDIG